MGYNEKIQLVFAEDNLRLCKKLQQVFEEDSDILLKGIAHNGSEAVDLICATQPDVALLDIVMPYKDGISVIEEVMRLDIKKPVFIIMSAIGQDEFITKAMSIGAQYYIIKPFNMDDLLKRIKTFAFEEKTEKDPPLFFPITHFLTAEEEIANILHHVGIFSNLKGYQYLKDAITLVVNDNSYLLSITKRLYPHVAESNDTTSMRVERSIRHCIISSWNRGGSESFAKLFHYHLKKEKPTNSEFIAAVSERVTIKWKNRNAHIRS